ncbi:MAG: hypothetical protein QW041_02005 [Candidatus Pacearchaeota archaeon]
MLSDTTYYLKFEEAKKALRTAEHMVYITYPLLKENRLLLKALEEIYLAVKIAIDLILKREYELKRIKIYSDSKTNMVIFEQKCALRYNFIAEEIEGIKRIINLFERHKLSPMEFARHNKLIIMSDDLRTESITLPILKNMLSIAKKVVRKTENSLIVKDI